MTTATQEMIIAGAIAGDVTDDKAREIIEAALAATPQLESQHADDIAVDRFAVAMKAKLAKKRNEGRGGWEDRKKCSNALLSRLLVEHLQKGDPVDIGNFAMMIHQRGEGVGVARGTASALSQLHAIVDAWEALPGGRQVKNHDVEAWLANHMAPAINAIRGLLRRKRPDGILPSPPLNSALASPSADLMEEVKRLKHELASAAHQARNSKSNADYWKSQYELATAMLAKSGGE